MKLVLFQLILKYPCFRHDDLVAQEGIYADMWHQQLKNELEGQKDSDASENSTSNGIKGSR